MQVTGSGDPGLMLKDGIIALAEVLTLQESAPGYCAALFLLLTAIASLRYLARSGSQLRAIRDLDGRVRQHADPTAFAEGYNDFTAGLQTDFQASSAHRAVWQAFSEFDETIVRDDIDGPLRLRNPVRPASFLNVDDLGFGPGFFRVLPNTLVSAGLLLTFLGLVAALHQFSQSINGASDSMNSAMYGFMQIASAKFVMSLAGLFCSILFTLILRKRQSQIEDALHHLCSSLEARLSFLSLEDVAMRQLRETREQRAHLQTLGTSLVAQLREPLDALPDAITSAISSKMDPIFERVTSLGTSSMEGLVGDLSQQLSHSVGNALRRASESLGEATDRIGLMVDRMSGANTQAGDGLREALDQMARALAEMRSEVSASGRAASETMNEGAERLLSVMNETLAGIRDNTGQGAEAMRAAADEMKQAADNFRQTLDNASKESAEAARQRMAASTEEAGQAIAGAGRALLHSFGQTSQDIARLGSEMGEVIGAKLLSRLEEIATRLSEMADAVQRGASGAQSAALGLNSGADAIHGASEGFRAAGLTLSAAADPVRASHERIETTLRRVGDLVETVSETLMQNSATVAENAAHVLESARTALGTEREGIRRNLEATRVAIAQLSSEAEKLDGIDQMLGRALKEYSTQLEAALGTAQDHVALIQKTLEPGITTLHEVVAQAEQFMPHQKRVRT
ncbi:hypothetical protein GWI72_05360 [Microvirga tunisiensis]|uniref:Methyl-accepting chemotaxis protein n=1 Tax=Pannonibacter tanglangensis TaxID=2750084 RepID=A0A7X5F391_9HYPH|nr:hypothetical protein [Pannonibacter sp. XCT-53]NBN77694.1 hypothetical protein [Pannonibacter sp. XCT-53]